jgi:hypothetical protein
MSFLNFLKKHEIKILFIFSIIFVVCHSQDVLTNSYWIEFHHDINHDDANKIAETHGFKNIGPVSTFLLLF